MFQKIENEIFEQWSLGGMYLKLRLSDAMYYHADNNEKELQDSVKIYEEAMNYIKRENRLLFLSSKDMMLKVAFTIL